MLPGLDGLAFVVDLPAARVAVIGTDEDTDARLDLAVTAHGFVVAVEDFTFVPVEGEPFGQVTVRRAEVTPPAALPALPAAVVVTDGQPQAIASSGGRPNPSYRLG